jgi:hypothetical protein
MEKRKMSSEKTVIQEVARIATQKTRPSRAAAFKALTDLLEAQEELKDPHDWAALYAFFLPAVETTHTPLQCLARLLGPCKAKPWRELFCVENGVAYAVEPGGGLMIAIHGMGLVDGYYDRAGIRISPTFFTRNHGGDCERVLTEWLAKPRRPEPITGWEVFRQDSGALLYRAGEQYFQKTLADSLPEGAEVFLVDGENAAVFTAVVEGLRVEGILMGCRV